MAYEDGKRSTPQRPHSLQLDERKKLTLTGVEDVDSFDDTHIVLRTVCGTLIIKGRDLQIGRLELDGGELSVTGLVSSLDYEETAPSGSLWTRLFH